MRTSFVFFLLLPWLLGAQPSFLSFSSQSEGIRLLERSETSFTFQTGIPALEILKTERAEGTFNLIQLQGSMRDLAIPGYPDLPVITRLISLPENAEAEFDILSQKTEIIDLNTLSKPFPVLPVQPSVSKSEDPENLPFQINRAAYQVDAYTDQKLVRIEYLGRMRGVRIARLTIAPFRYNPIRNLLEVSYDISVKIRFTGANLALTQEVQKKYDSPIFQRNLQILLNHSPESTLDVITKYPVKYVIVADPMFQAALQPFIAWKTRKGFTVIEAYTNNPLVGSTTSSIKNYLQNLYQSATPNDPAPSYALLVGDVAQIPAFNGTTGSHPSDLYYFTFDGPSDYLPDMYYGRFSANNLAELQPQIDKTLEYEQFLMPDPSFLNKVVMVAGVDSYYGNTHANGQINYGNTYYFNTAHGLTSSTYLYPASGSSSSLIISDISNGVGFANYTAHCGTNGWSDPSFTTSHINNLENTSKYPLVIGNCCLSNKFDQTCFGEAMLRAQNKGALGYIGGSNNTLWDEDFYWSVGVGTPMANPTYAGTSLGAYDRLFHDNGESRTEWFETNGQIIMAGNLAVSASSSSEVKYYWEIYHLMGDPSVMTYFSVPPVMSVTYAPLLPLGTNTFNISAEPYVYAGISKDGILHGAGIADSLGQLNLNILPFTSPGYAHVVITKQNRKPYIDSVLVASPSGPYILINQVEIIDTIGNDNGRADHGEFIQLNIALTNYGSGFAGMVAASLHTGDTFVSLIDSIENWGDFAAGDTILRPLAFAFEVRPLIPDKHQVPFQLFVSDTSGSTWISNFSIKLHAPDLKILSLSIDDTQTGNGNGSIDPGESVELKVNVKNAGHADALNSSASLITYHPMVTISNTSILLDTLKEEQSMILGFIAQIDPNMPLGEAFEVHCSLQSGWYSSQMSFAPLTGSLQEDWETGTLTKYNWVAGGNQPWTIVSSGAFQGTYAARSGNIGNNEESSLEITLNILTHDSISFYRKVSSEANYDFLQFFIDNNLQDQWSGQKDWARVAYPVSPGTRTFRWVYSKDYYLASGSDCAWIDFIKFPAVAGVVTSSADRNPEEMQVEIFPNPAKGFTNILLNNPVGGMVDLHLFDATGRLIYTQAGIDTSFGKRMVELDITRYNPGVLYLRVTAGQSRINKKILVIQ